LPDAGFEESLDLIAASGATGVSLAGDRMRDGQEQAHLETFRASGLSAAACLPTHVTPLPVRPALMFPGPEDPAERVPLMIDSVRQLAPFDPDCIVVATGTAEGYERDAAFEIAVNGIREVARVAGELGTRLGVEVIRGGLGFEASFLQTLPEAVEFLDAVDAPNVGLCFDVHHLWNTVDALPLAEELADRIVCVQFSGWREPPRCLADRVLPGDGAEDLPAFLGALERGGFDGWYDFELFSDDGRWGTDLPDSLWKLPYPELLERAHAGFQRAWAARPGADR
jgi:sugar phosphate isomerase/epimerase